MTPTEIRQARIAKGWTQKQMAEAMGDISTRVVRMWEAGDCNMSATSERLFKILTMKQEK